jgi:hypothetical protein
MHVWTEYETSEGCCGSQEDLRNPANPWQGPKVEQEASVTQMRDCARSGRVKLPQCELYNVHDRSYDQF